MGMSDENSASTITEALERAARLHAEVLAQIDELLRDDEVMPLDDGLLETATHEA